MTTVENFQELWLRPLEATPTEFIKAKLCRLIDPKKYVKHSFMFCIASKIDLVIVHHFDRELPSPNNPTHKMGSRTHRLGGVYKPRGQKGGMLQ